MSTSGLALLLRKENRVFDLARQGRRLPGVLMALLVILGVLAIAFAPFAAAAELIYGSEDALQELWGGAFFLIAPFLLVIVSLGLWVRGYEKRPFSTAGFETQRRFRKYLTGLVIGFAMMAATVAMMVLAGTLEVDKAAARPMSGGVVASVLLMLMAFLVQGGAEEIMFRGWLLQVLGARYSPRVGLLVSSVVFATFHGSTSLVVNVNLFLFAVFLAFYYLYEGSIWGAMGWHSAWNWAQASVFGVTVSGVFESDQALMNLRSTGSPLLSGGDFGPEASLSCTAVFLFGLVILAVLSRRAPHGSL